MRAKNWFPMKVEATLGDVVFKCSNVSKKLAYSHIIDTIRNILTGCAYFAQTKRKKGTHK